MCYLVIGNIQRFKIMPESAVKQYCIDSLYGNFVVLYVKTYYMFHIFQSFQQHRIIQTSRREVYHVVSKVKRERYIALKTVSIEVSS